MVHRRPGRHPVDAGGRPETAAQAAVHGHADAAAVRPQTAAARNPVGADSGSVPGREAMTDPVSCVHLGQSIGEHDCPYCERELMRPLVEAAIAWFNAENSWRESMTRYMLKVECRRYQQRRGR